MFIKIYVSLYFFPACHLISDYRCEGNIRFCLVLCVLVQKRNGVKVCLGMFKFMPSSHGCNCVHNPGFMTRYSVSCRHDTACCAACCDSTFGIFHMESYDQSRGRCGGVCVCV